MFAGRLRKFFPFFLNVLLVLFFVLSLIFFLFHLYFQQRIIPGVYLPGVGNLSGRSETEVRQKLESLYGAYNRSEITLDFGSQKFTETVGSLGLVMDATASARQALRVGRSGSILADLKVELQSLFQGQEVTPVYYLNSELWREKISWLAQNLSGQDAHYDFEKVLVVVPETAGYVGSIETLEEKIFEGLISLENPLSVEIQTQVPQVTTADLQDHFEEVSALVLGRPHLSYLQKAFSLSEKEFLGFLVVKKGAPLSLDLDEVKSFVEKQTGSLNRPTKTLSFEVQEKTIRNFSPGQDGIEVNVEETAGKLAAALLSGKKEKVEVALKRTKAPVAVNQLGIRELLAEGTSNFSGSIPGRIKNIRRASSQLNGVLIEPGTVFSFNQGVGEISAETGYDYAYIIKEGRTVLGTGGGVCQVSTTVFRAALNAGLPILKRNAHAYRVHYYEQGSPVGIDATVFPPSVDLQFKNDTPSYLLMTTEVEGENLRIRLYGQSDGRKVKLIGPTILSTSPAPAPLYQEDPTLPVGVTRQVDFAAGGAVVVLERKVLRGGEVLFSDKFTSNYRPWQAIYLVGTKT